MDEWWEEDEQVFVHARDPRKSITVVECFRPVEVVLDGTVVASTRRARRLDETDLPARYYIPREDVRTDLLVPSGTRTRCPYKGEAVYWSARMPERTVEDVVWSYPRPIAECPRIASMMCFYNEVVDAIRVGGAHSGEADHRIRCQADHRVRSSRSPVGAKRRGGSMMPLSDRLGSMKLSSFAWSLL